MPHIYTICSFVSWLFGQLSAAFILYLVAIRPLLDVSCPLSGILFGQLSAAFILYLVAIRPAFGGVHPFKQETWKKDEKIANINGLISLFHPKSRFHTLNGWTFFKIQVEIRLSFIFFLKYSSKWMIFDFSRLSQRLFFILNRHFIHKKMNRCLRPQHYLILIWKNTPESGTNNWHPKSNSRNTLTKRLLCLLIYICNMMLSFKIASVNCKQQHSST